MFLRVCQGAGSRDSANTITNELFQMEVTYMQGKSVQTYAESVRLFAFRERLPGNKEHGPVAGENSESRPAHLK